MAFSYAWHNYYAHARFDGLDLMQGHSGLAEENKSALNYIDLTD